MNSEDQSKEMAHKSVMKLSIKFEKAQKGKGDQEINSEDQSNEMEFINIRLEGHKEEC